MKIISGKFIFASLIFFLVMSFLVNNFLSNNNFFSDKDKQTNTSTNSDKMIGVEIRQQNQTSDWGLETLSESQLKYAASDVLYLHQIKNKLDQILKRENKEEIAKKCFKFLKTRSELDLIGFGNLDIFAH